MTGKTLLKIVLEDETAPTDGEYRDIAVEHLPEAELFVEGLAKREVLRGKGRFLCRQDVNLSATLLLSVHCIVALQRGQFALGDEARNSN